MPRFAGGGRYRPQRDADLAQEIEQLEHAADNYKEMHNARVAYGVVMREGKEPPLAGNAEYYRLGKLKWPETGEKAEEFIVYFPEEDPDHRSVERLREKFEEASEQVNYETGETEQGDLLFWEERPLDHEDIVH